MCMKLIEEGYALDEVVFYDWGMEFQSVYYVRDRMRDYFRSHGVRFTEIRPQEAFIDYMLNKKVNGYKNGVHYGYSWCGGRCRWGTSIKNRDITKYLETKYGKDNYLEYVGVAWDEQKRIKDKLYPLVWWHMTEHDCLEYCYTHGIGWLEYSPTLKRTIDLYSILDRVSCWCCANKNKKELRNIKKYLPQYWEKLCCLSDVANTEYKNLISIRKENQT